MKKTSLFAYTFLLSLTGLSQDLREEFLRFRSSQEIAFLEEVRRQDSIFAVAIKENWMSFQLNEPYEYLPSYPKPTSQPKNEQEIPSRNYQVDSEAKKLRTFRPTIYEHLDFYPEEDLEIAFDFYGQDCQFKYPSSLIEQVKFEPTKEFVADFWQMVSQRPYQKVLNELVQFKERLNVPGFGLTIILEEFTRRLGLTGDMAILYNWFFLSKAGYDTRVGFSQGEPFLIIASETRLYGKPYFKEGASTYYVLASGVKEIETFSEVRTGASAPVDFFFLDAPDLSIDAKQKSFSFTHGEVEYHWEIYYNQHLVDFLEEFPFVDLPAYLNSKGSFLLEKSLRKAITPDLKDKSQVEIIALLLSFSQKAFDYETDQIQFGRERVFYPEQFIHFEKSDCDDRAVFFNYLISLFTEVKTVALLFPQHIAIGANLPQPAFGETVDYAGSRFTFCDPTFYNAPIGTVIPQADRNQMKVLSF